MSCDKLSKLRSLESVIDAQVPAMPAMAPPEAYGARFRCTC